MLTFEVDTNPVVRQRLFPMNARGLLLQWSIFHVLLIFARLKERTIDVLKSYAC